MSYEISNILITNPKGIYIDCTFGGGGHSAYLLDKFKDIKIIAMDCDEDSQKHFKENQHIFGNRISFIRENFKNIKSACLSLGVQSADGILADIGVSSRQFDDMKRGFSFNSDILDMRMDNRNALTAKEIINDYEEEKLADIFYQYGQEYLSRPIAAAIIKRRMNGKINTAKELRNIISAIKKREGAIDPSTKVFQALRIYVNDELSNLKSFLENAPSILNTNGIISIISFHSLEDLIVKQNFKNNAKAQIYSLINKKVIAASPAEIKNNPRSRSAKLRAAKKI